MFEATTGSVIMKVVKIGAQFDSPNQMIEMTIHTKTDVALSTDSRSWTTSRTARDRNAARPSAMATATAPPNPIAMRESDAAVCRQISPLATMATKPRMTDHGEGSTYAPYLSD